MDAVLLAGGFGTRLRPLTYTRPKPLLPVAGRAMVDWVLDRLPTEVDRLIATVNWRAEELEAHLQDKDIECIVVKEDEPLGTAGAVKNAEDHFGSDRFFVLNADIVSEMDLAAMAKQHQETGGHATIALKEVPRKDVVHYGVVSMDPEDATRIVSFHEKPRRPEDAPSRLINAGAYLLEKSVLDLIPAGMVSMEQEIFPKLLDDFRGYTFDGSWIDVGDPERLRAAGRLLDSKYRWGPDADVADDVAWLDSVAGRGLRVGPESRIENCVLGDDVTVEAESFLVDCVVGDGQTVGGALSGQRVWNEPVPEGYPAKQVGNALKA